MNLTNAILFFLLSICSLSLNASQGASSAATDKIAKEQQKHDVFQKRVNEILESEQYKRKVYFDLNELVMRYCDSGKDIELAQAKAARQEFEDQNKELVDRLIVEQLYRDLEIDPADSDTDLKSLGN